MKLFAWILIVLGIFGTPFYGIGIVLIIVGIIMLSSASKEKQAQVQQVAQKIVESRTLRKCPFCKELIAKDAVLCKHCKSKVEPEVSTEPEKKIKYDGANPLWTCSQCGRSFYADTLFCKDCKLPRDEIAVRE